ncbi:DUF6452 family protein [Cesiribacter andamanensis]|uniref:Uncharacterized protein n=1 Tax=Cesiribacter andamanensis AMV16 TaxID=1279009 RepID=M7N2A5_9BACT|nr:DUF6452 family protein [Cesiribacter andamanensis]EMR01442.1 hypothetical protein ADICEAN_03428 [Cesiribacter andamanensis AMV16]
MRYFVLILFSLFGFWGCQPDEACFSSATNRLVLGFYQQSVNGPITDTVVVGQVKSTASDSLFWNNTIDSTRAIFLYLNPLSDTTTILFKRTSAPARDDTLVLAYQRRYRLIAPDCPLEVSFEELSVVRSTFATTRVLNTELREPSNEADVQVFY